MRDVANKPETLRLARASGRLVYGKALPPEALVENAKGDLPTLARVAGLQWAKQLPLLLPDAHPIRLTSGGLTIEEQQESIVVTAECAGIDRTGVEMEALAMCLGALMSLWDALKPALKDLHGQYPGIAIQDVQVLLKEKAGTAHSVAKGLPAGVIVATDTRRMHGDESGPAVQQCLEAAGCKVMALTRVPDEVAALRQAIEESLHHGIRLVIVTGGTGAGIRDVTPQAIESFGGIPLPGFGEAFRSMSLARVGVHAVLSRATCSMVEWKGHHAVVAAIPGHPEAATVLANTVPALLHAAELWGNNHA